MSEQTLDKAAVLGVFNSILEWERAGAKRYTHDSLMVFSFSHIPIVQWQREQAKESLAPAMEVGELITALGGHPSLGIGRLFEGETLDVAAILREALEHEQMGLAAYRQLLTLVEGRDIVLEDYARGMTAAERWHVSEVDKMLRTPADLKAVAS
jgi:bacterioferritin